MGDSPATIPCPTLAPGNPTTRSAEPRPQHCIEVGAAAAWFILFGRCGVGFRGRRVLFLAAMAASSGKARAVHRLLPWWLSRSS